MNMIEFNNVSKKFKRGEKLTSLRDVIPNFFRKALSTNNGNDLKEEEFWALQEVNFTVEKGENVGIMGPNGAGKSTILKLLAGIMKPNKGQLKVSGRLSALIEVTAGFHTELTGRENTYLNGTIMGMNKKEIDKKFDQIVEFSGIREFIDTPVKRYSSGMQSRLGFSVAAFMDSDILLVDEVLSVGDTAFQAKCAQKMRELINSGTTIVLVSHNLALIQSICKRVILIDKGRVLKEGDPVDVIQFYQESISKRQEAETRETFSPDEYKVKVNREELIEVVNISMHGEQHEYKDVFAFGETMSIGIELKSREKTEEPIIILDIMRHDGVVCCSINSKEDAFIISNLGETGKINIDLGKINLAPGIYLVKVSVWDKEMIHVYTTAKKDIFRIETGKFVNSEAIFLPKARWSLE
ncbi:ABC transporter ATP-binding protein [bacterium]|nr:MAG: ABC transporter ATP-binding protein [bacterium]